MARQKKYDDDDGRSIADMSGVEGPSLFLPRARKKPPEEPPQRSDRPWESQEGLTGQERRWYVLGALKASLAIALAFILGLGVVILLMLLFWT
jgi:hypothetical protein